MSSTPFLAVLSAAVTATAVAGGIATTPQDPWYLALDKPVIQPPGWVFGPVWTALYASIALTSGRQLAELDGQERRHYATALATNLALNAGWSWVFFRGKNLPAATGVAVALAASSVDLARRTSSPKKSRGRTLVPYAAWACFASVLTAAVWRRNRLRG